MSKEQTNVKSKLFKLREWLTLNDAARHLSIMFDEQVDEADVLRLALDGHLKLSVNFVNFTNALHITEALPEYEEHRGRLAIHFLGQYYGKKFKVSDEVDSIVKGVWDLLPIGNGRLIIEKRYHDLKGGPAVNLLDNNGTFLRGKSEKIISLQERLSNQHVGYPGDPRNYKMANDLPNDSILVMRTKALLELQEKIYSKESTTGAKPGTQVDTDLFDAKHDFYAKELKIAVEAWTELYKKNPPPHVPQGGHKTYIAKWLEEKHPSLSLRAKERIATIVNPNSKGGASPIE